MIYDIYIIREQKKAVRIAGQPSLIKLFIY
jgi:hypothetical protein